MDGAQTPSKVQRRVALVPCWGANAPPWLDELKPGERLSHRLLKVRAGINVVVPCPLDGPVDYKLRNAAPERIGSLARNDLVLLRCDDGHRNPDPLKRKRSVDLMLEKGTDGEPGVHRLRDRS